MDFTKEWLENTPDESRSTSKERSNLLEKISKYRIDLALRTLLDCEENENLGNRGMRRGLKNWGRKSFNRFVMPSCTAPNNFESYLSIETIMKIEVAAHCNFRQLLFELVLLWFCFGNLQSASIGSIWQLQSAERLICTAIYGIYIEISLLNLIIFLFPAWWDVRWEHST